MLLITFLHLKHQEVYYCIEQTFQPCHCQNLEDTKRFPTKPGDLAKNLKISMDGKLQ